MKLKLMTNLMFIAFIIVFDELLIHTDGKPVKANGEELIEIVKGLNDAIVRNKSKHFL